MRELTLTAALIATFAAAGPAVGDDLIEKLGIAVCAKIADNTERLTCFDKIAKIKSEAAAQAQSNATEGFEKGPGSWEVRKKLSKIDDSPEVMLVLKAEEPIATSWGKTEPYLIVQCSGKATSLFVNWNLYLISPNHDEDMPVRLRIDGAAATKTAWRQSTNSKATGLWSGGSSIPFIKLLLERSELVVQALSRQEEPIATFKLAGLSAAIAPIREACKW